MSEPRDPVDERDDAQTADTRPDPRQARGRRPVVREAGPSVTVSAAMRARDVSRPR